MGIAIDRAALALGLIGFAPVTASDSLAPGRAYDALAQPYALLPEESLALLA